MSVRTGEVYRETKRRGAAIMRLPWMTFAAIALCAVVSSASSTQGIRGLLTSATSMFAGALVVWATEADLRRVRKP